MIYCSLSFLITTFLRLIKRDCIQIKILLVVKLINKVALLTSKTTWKTNKKNFVTIKCWNNETNDNIIFFSNSTNIVHFTHGTDKMQLKKHLVQNRCLIVFEEATRPVTYKEEYNKRNFLYLFDGYRAFSIGERIFKIKLPKRRYKRLFMII